MTASYCYVPRNESVVKNSKPQGRAGLPPPPPPIQVLHDKPV